MVLVAVGHPAFTDAQDNSDVLLLHSVELHDSNHANTLREACLLEEVALSDFIEEGDHLPLSLGREAFKIGLNLNPGAAWEAFILVWLSRSRTRHEITVYLLFSLGLFNSARLGLECQSQGFFPVRLVDSQRNRCVASPFFQNEKC